MSSVACNGLLTSRFPEVTVTQHWISATHGIYCIFIQYREEQMNAPLLPEVLRLREDSPQEALPLATDGVHRYVWESRFGSMLIEVVDGVAYVNGGRVEAIASEGPDVKPAAPSPKGVSS